MAPPSAPATVDAAVGKLLEAIDVVVPFLAPLVIAEEELPEAEPVADAVGAGVMVNTVTCVIVLVWRFEPRVSCTMVDVESWTLCDDWASESRGKARRKESRYIAEGRRLVGATMVQA